MRKKQKKRSKKRTKKQLPQTRDAEPGGQDEAMRFWVRVIWFTLARGIIFLYERLGVMVDGWLQRF